ncbi:MAG: FtsW/RodA/SpoVE family cell cycle protein [Anaerolineae bacterium]|nr:FtsW/RodA/SpoVE family cell cycle protein [Anaerolineae bacterium]MDH7472641.1 FtsW/RodA/SpoVE family cell cycle protein [Anaerolineae bacterium]
MKRETRNTQHATRNVTGLTLLALAILFTGTGFVSLSLVERGYVAWGTLWPAIVLGGASLAAWAVLRRWLPAGDPLLLPIAALLCGLGLVLIARLAPNFLGRQVLWVVLGLGAMLAVALLPPAPYNLRWLQRYRYTWLTLGLLLLSLTLLFGVNPSGYGARLWLGLSRLYFQPSELLKVVMVVFLASYLAEKRELLAVGGTRIGRWRLPPLPHLGPLLLMWGFSVVLLGWQRDLGAALLFFGTFLAMLYAATGREVYIWVGMGLFLVSAIVGYQLFDHVRLRVDAWWNPWPEASGRAFQIVQSLLAFAAGGVLGQGLGQGYPIFIPVVHSDFAFAAIGEELGLLGTLAVVILFAILVYRGFRAALAVRDTFAALLATGLSTMLGLQALVIMGGTLKIVPLTGVTLPFVSYGGSSLLISFVMLGLLLRISAISEEAGHAQ